MYELVGLNDALEVLRTVSESQHSVVSQLVTFFSPIYSCWRTIMKPSNLFLSV